MAKGHDELPPGKVWEGPSGAGRNSIWLTNEDLPHDKDVRLVVESVMMRENVKFEGGRTEPQKLSLKFRGWKRELALNATNRKVMVKLFGNRCKDWFGKSVILYVQQDVDTPKGPQPAVRIRAKRADASVPEHAEPARAEPPAEATGPGTDLDTEGVTQ